jgi:SAM-dependent methyltransferase
MNDTLNTAGQATQPHCLMCGSTRLVVDAVRPTVDLVQGYQARFGVDARRYLAGDSLVTHRCAACDLRSHFGGTPGDSDFYDQMQTHPFYYESDKPEFQYAVDWLVRLKAQTVLEVGCGEGNFLAKIQSAFESRGSELSAKSLAKLKQRGIALDEGDSRYDVVCTFQVLEHVVDVDSFVRFLVSKVKPGGHLIVTVPNRDSKYIAEGTSSILDFPPHHMTQWSKLALHNMAVRYGATVVDDYTEPMRPTHMAGLLAARRAQVPGGARARKWGRLVGRLVDMALVPYHLDRIDYPGHTHGVVLRVGG